MIRRIAASAALATVGLCLWAAMPAWAATMLMEGKRCYDVSGAGNGPCILQVQPVDPSGTPIGGVTTSKPTNATGAYSAVTVGASSAQALAASTATVFLDLVNESATATVACAFGATAVINGAGSITLPPGWHRSWEGTFVPSDAVNCIASAGSTPFSIGAK